MQAKDCPTYHMLLTGHDHGSRLNPPCDLSEGWVGAKNFPVLFEPTSRSSGINHNCHATNPQPQKNNYQK